jgi:hypothetical protein
MFSFHHNTQNQTKLLDSWWRQMTACSRVQVRQLRDQSIFLFLDLPQISHHWHYRWQHSYWLNPIGAASCDPPEGETIARNAHFRVFTNSSSITTNATQHTPDVLINDKQGVVDQHKECNVNKTYLSFVIGAAFCGDSVGFPFPHHRGRLGLCQLRGCDNCSSGYDLFRI